MTAVATLFILSAAYESGVSGAAYPMTCPYGTSVCRQWWLRYAAQPLL